MHLPTVLEKILIESDNYEVNNCFNSTVSHTDAQDNFLFGSVENNPIAMLVEGVWWENEASSTFAEMKNLYGLGKDDRRFAVMPFPKADASRLGEATYYNTQKTMGFINAKCTGKKLELAKAFLKFAYSEEKLQEFTVLTRTPISLNYTLTPEQYETLNHFGKSVWDIHSGKMGKVVHQISTNPAMQKNLLALRFDNSFNSKVGDTTQNVPADCFRKNSCSALEYYQGISKYFDQTWWQSNIK